jgi:hypothetical protein
MVDTHPPDLDESLAESRRHARRTRILSTRFVVIWIAFCPMWFAIDMLDDSSSIWSYWPMLGTGTGVLITAIVLLGTGGLFGADWERREEANDLRRRPTSPAASTKFAVPRAA